MVSYKLFLILFIIPLAFSDLCYNSNFYSILLNQENSFEIGPNKESCYKYSLSLTKKKIILVFPKLISITSEVLLYKSKSDIKISDNEYKNYLDRFLINENLFKEIDLSNYDNEIYIIIRDNKYNELYKNYFILYDTEIPIKLKEGKPLTIKYFIKNNEYKFEFSSSKSLTFVYSTKVKNKKYISITYNNKTILSKQKDEIDHIFNLKSENSTIKKLYVTVEDIEEGVEDQEFSVIVYEKDINQFFEIKRGNAFTLNYLSLNHDDEKQIFLFYHKLSDINKINSINFKLDPEASKTNYINIESGIYHSMKEIPDDEKYISLRFNKDHQLPIQYDINSNEYKKIYFQDTDTSFTYRYVYFKVEIAKSDKYFSPKNFIITVGYGLTEKNFISIEYYRAQIMALVIEPNTPTYIKLLLDPKEKYILSSPLPDSTIFTKGDLIIKDENQNIKINNNQFTDPDEILILSDISEISISFINPFAINTYFYLEKYKEKDVYIIENYRNYEPFYLSFDENECKDNKMKYLLGIYNKDIYSKYNKTYTKYWTSNDGDFNVYYRNGVTLENNNLFPTNNKYLQKKEYTIVLNFFIDFFTFSCNKPGTLSLRSPYKIFNETTHKISQNSLLKITVSNKLEIIQLTAPIKPPNNYLYFGLFSKYGKKIKISADYPPLFSDTIIEEDKPFLQKIDLYKYESDQLAIKILAEEITEIEIVEVIKYNFTEYTIIKDSKKKKITDNHFVRFLNLKTKEIKVKINGLENTEIYYGFVQLFTNDVNYLPMASQLKDSNIKRKEVKENEYMIIKNPYLENNDNTKKYLAFIFSIPEFKYREYEVQIIADNEKDEDGVNTLVIILSALVCVITLIATIIIILNIYAKRKKGEKVEYLNEKNNEDNNENINNNFINNDETNINRTDEKIKDNNNKIISFEDEDDDKRLYKSFDDD